MSIKKSDFIKKLREGETANSILSNVPPQKDIDDAQARVGKVQQLMGQLKNMGVDGIAEDFEISKDYSADNDGNTSFFKDLIDHLMYKLYGITYFNEITDKDEYKPEQKPISQMSQSEFNDLSHIFKAKPGLSRVLSLIKTALGELNTSDMNNNNPLKVPYLTLQDISRREGEENLNENFINSEIFGIIAESETPKISKQEILEFLKRL